MKQSIMRRLEQLEAAVPGDLIVEYSKGDELEQSTMKEFCRLCRKDKVIYAFKVVDGNRMDDIDLLIKLIDEQAKGTL